MEKDWNSSLHLRKKLLQYRGAKEKERTCNANFVIRIPSAMMSVIVMECLLPQRLYGICGIWRHGMPRMLSFQEMGTGWSREPLSPLWPLARCIPGPNWRPMAQLLRALQL